jgi:hypothetical protein
MTPKLHALLNGLLPASIVAIILFVANHFPSYEETISNGIPTKKQWSYGWPFIAHWTECNTFNGERIWTEPCNGDDDEACGYNCMIGISVFVFVWGLTSVVYLSRRPRT